MRYEYLYVENELYLQARLDYGDVVNKVAYGMVHNNQVAGVLPVWYRCLGEENGFRYHIGSRMTLKQYLEQATDRERFLGICQSIFRFLKEIDRYLLVREDFIWDVNSVFVDEAGLQFILIPVEIGAGCNVSLADFLRKLVEVTNFTEGHWYAERVCEYLESTSQPCYEEIANQMKQIGSSDFSSVLVAPEFSGEIETTVLTQNMLGTQPEPEPADKKERRRKLFFGRKTACC